MTTKNLKTKPKSLGQIADMASYKWMLKYNGTTGQALNNRLHWNKVASAVAREVRRRSKRKK